MYHILLALLRFALPALMVSSLLAPFPSAPPSLRARQTAEIVTGDAPAVSPTVIAATTPTWGYRIVHTYRHDANAFTQGLVYHNGFLYEGTGLYGQSTLRKVQLATGSVLQSVPLASQYFGEGITIFGDRIIQLTWQNYTGFVYDRASFAELDSFSYATEGWGLTHDGQRLIMSDGTARLLFLNPTTFAPTGSVDVHDQGTPISQLNELEYVNGEVFANVWFTELIARIDPLSGRVTGWIDLSGLQAAQGVSDDEAVLNGIAYDPATGRLWVTGKLWPNLYEIELVPPFRISVPLILR